MNIQDLKNSLSPNEMFFIILKQSIINFSLLLISLKTFILIIINKILIKKLLGGVRISFNFFL